MPRLTRPLAVVTAIVTGGCGQESLLAPVAHCAELTAVTVSAGSPPAVTWAPDCRLGFVRIETTEGEGLWTLFSSANSLRSPVHYGEAPPGSLEQGDAPPLVAGATYSLILGVVEPSNTLTFGITTRYSDSFVHAR